MRGKHAARREHRHADALEAELVALRQQVAQLKVELKDAQGRASYVPGLESQLQKLRDRYENDAELERLKAEVKRLKQVDKELFADYEAALLDFYTVVTEFGRLLEWKRPQQEEFVARHAPHIRLPWMDDEDFTSGVGVQRRDIDNEGRRRIQQARGLR